MNIIECERAEIMERTKAENELIHQRMTWLGSIQGLLFAAIAFAWNLQTARPIVYLVAIVGVLTAVSIGYAIYRANSAINTLSTYLDTIKPENFKGLDVEGVRSSSGISWLMPGAFIPPMLACCWVAILFVAAC